MTTVSTAGLVIEQVAPDDSRALADFADVRNRARSVDAAFLHPTTAEDLRGIFELGYDGEPPVGFVARLEDRAVAIGDYHVSEWDNLDLAWFEVGVVPEARRRGIGSAVLAHLEAEAARLGRTKLGSDAFEGTPGVGFLLSHGYEQRSRAILRRQHLDGLDLDDVRRLHAEAEAAAADYELVRVAGLTPEELLAPLASAAASINDAPLDDLDLEDEVYAPERIARFEQTMLQRGRRLRRVVARHRGTGEVVGHTVLLVEGPRPSVGHQGDTTVVPAHRGHRLGMLLKSAMVLWLAEEEPELRTVDTWNAESNDPMIAVNERLGYRWTARELQFQKP